jgi:glycogen synthase
MKPEYMDAIRKRREYLIWQEQVEAETKRIAFLKQMKQETMRCNAISQRIALQEYFIEREPEISKEIQEWVDDDEKIKTLDRATVEDMLDTWLADFHLVQPSDFFKDHPTNDSELVCSI